MTETGTPLITISQAIAADACTDGVSRMRDLLREAFPDASAAELDAIPVSIGDVALVSLNYARWCLRMLSDRRTIVRAVMPAVKRASAHTSDPRVHDCIAAVDRWLDGGDGADLRHAATEAWAAERAAAQAAARAAARAAWRAAHAALAAGEAAEWAVIAARAADLVALFPPVLKGEA